jgi:gamma-butyrobetaine dioxygenase
MGSAVRLRREDRFLTITWPGGRDTPFHLVRLRDACAYAACGDPAFGGKTLLAKDLPEDLAVEGADVAPDGAITAVRRSDGHRSRYGLDWLRGHAYDEGSRRERAVRRKPGTTEIPHAWPGFDNAAALAGDGSLYDLLHVVSEFGSAFVTDVPTEGGPETFAVKLGVGDPDAVYPGRPRLLRETPPERDRGQAARASFADLTAS